VEHPFDPPVDRRVGDRTPRGIRPIRYALILTRMKFSFRVSLSDDRRCRLLRL